MKPEFITARQVNFTAKKQRCSIAVWKCNLCEKFVKKSRGMTINRRSEERVSTNLLAKWDGLAGGNEARIEDLSMSGCFVNSVGRVDVGDIVGIEIKMPSGQWLPLRGEVCSYHHSIGFGMLFSFLTEDEEEALREMVKP